MIGNTLALLVAVSLKFVNPAAFQKAIGIAEVRWPRFI
jgi:hypothetical protein